MQVTAMGTEASKTAEGEDSLPASLSWILPSKAGLICQCHCSLLIELLQFIHTHRENHFQVLASETPLQQLQISMESRLLAEKTS